MTILLIFAVLLAILYLGIGIVTAALTGIFRQDASLLYLLYVLFFWPINSYFLRKYIEKMDKDYEKFKTKEELKKIITRMIYNSYYGKND